MEKISFIIPVYNREKTILKCINSILNQSLKDIEIIIINDGSIDNSEKIIKKIKDKRIKYFKWDNHGIGASRNKGIELSNGEYLSFVDSDDYISKDFSKKMYEKAIKEKSDIVVCNYNNFYKDGKINKGYIKEFKRASLKENKNLLLDINLGPCNKIFKKELFDDKEMRFPENIKYEDVNLVTKLLKKANKISYEKSHLSYFYIDNKSETTTMDERVFDIFIVLDNLRDTFKEKEYKNILETLIVFKITTYTVQQRYQKDKTIRNKFIDQAFNYLDKYVPNYKNNNYFKNRNIFKSIIEKNKIITKIYCDIYNRINN